MNRHLYRHVFNEARGQPMAVAESARGAGQAPGRRGGCARAGARVPGTRLRVLAFRLSLALGLGLGLAAILPAGEASAQVIAYRGAPATQQPIVLKAGNGVPVVDIRTPSAAGVSHNTYRQFDVNADGLILNNSRHDVATRLGGWIPGNPWLAGGTARIILNEVV
ncbi:MAG: hypothetical protein LBK99_04930, partial [Opitutaceae bacterium]|nr:hypothetical protein [Opitutaceae bacterium]